jgi:hypothetical protein
VCQATKRVAKIEQEFEGDFEALAPSPIVAKKSKPKSKIKEVLDIEHVRTLRDEGGDGWLAHLTEYQVPSPSLL